MTTVINQQADAIKSVVPCPPFKAKEIWTYDRGRVDELPGVTMAWDGAERVDDRGVTKVRHRRKYHHRWTVRLWFRTDPGDSKNNDRDMRDGVSQFLAAFSADPTLGGQVEGSAIASIDPPAVLQNAQGMTVGQAVDIHVVIEAFDPWQ